jgi:DNA-binding NarL/FixJ family response regulator
LTKLLVSAFPGSTIYRHTDLCRVSHDVLHNRVDAVFLEAETETASGLDVMRMLRRQKPELPVFIISKTNRLYEKAVAAGANGYFVLPDSEQHLLDAMRMVMKKENAS